MRLEVHRAVGQRRGVQELDQAKRDVQHGRNILSASARASTHPDDVSVTIRSRCRVMALRTPSVPAIADVLARRDGIDPATARMGGIGVRRARRPGPPVGPGRGGARAAAADPGGTRRAADLRRRVRRGRRSAGAAKGEARSMSERRDAAELEELKTALGAGGTGKGAVGAARGSAGVVKEMERRQKSTGHPDRAGRAGPRARGPVRLLPRRPRPEPGLHRAADESRTSRSR